MPLSSECLVSHRLSPRNFAYPRSENKIPVWGKLGKCAQNGKTDLFGIRMWSNRKVIFQMVFFTVVNKMYAWINVPILDAGETRDFSQLPRTVGAYEIAAEPSNLLETMHETCGLLARKLVANCALEDLLSRWIAVMGAQNNFVRRQQ